MIWTVRRNRVITMTLSTLDWALAYQQHGFAVYPMVPNDRIPLKGTHGYKDASNDPVKAKEWWGQHPEYNIGLSLIDTGVLVLDIDRNHGGADGIETVNNLYKQGAESLPDDTYTEQTPRGGLHYFLTYPTSLSLTAHTNVFSKNGEGTGVDYTALGVPVAPTRRAGKSYKPVAGHKLTTIRPAPQWVLDGIQATTRGNELYHYEATGRRKMWTGRLLDQIVNIDGSIRNGSKNRNSYLTSLAGKLFYTGADAKTVYNLLLVANSFIDGPLPDREVNNIFKSVLREETSHAS